MRKVAVSRFHLEKHSPAEKCWLISIHRNFGFAVTWKKCYEKPILQIVFFPKSRQWFAAQCLGSIFCGLVQKPTLNVRASQIISCRLFRQFHWFIDNTFCVHCISQMLMFGESNSELRKNSKFLPQILQAAQFTNCVGEPLTQLIQKSTPWE